MESGAARGIRKSSQISVCRDPGNIEDPICLQVLKTDTTSLLFYGNVRILPNHVDMFN